MNALFPATFIPDLFPRPFRAEDHIATLPRPPLRLAWALDHGPWGHGVLGRRSRRPRFFSVPQVSSLLQMTVVWEFS